MPLPTLLVAVSNRPIASAARCFPPAAPPCRVVGRGEGRFRAFVSIMWIARFIYMIYPRRVIL